MIEFVLAHQAAVLVGSYLAIMALIGLLIALEGQRYKERWSGTTAQPGFCTNLGKGLRRLGGARHRG